MGKIKEMMMQQQEQLDDSEYFNKPKKLKLGTVVMTPGVDALIAKNPLAYITIAEIIRMQENCIWGLNEYPEDKKANDEAAASGQDRCMGVHMVGDTKVYIITEWDRSVTTILLPSEY